MAKNTSTGIFDQNYTTKISNVTGDSSVYCTLSFKNGSGVSDSDASAVFTGRAPACQVTVQEQVNISTDRSLSGDWLMMTFGLRLVNISIVGLDIFEYTCNNSNKKGDVSIQDVFNAYNCAEHPKARVTLNLQTEQKVTSTYKCVLVALEKTKNNMKEPSAGLGNYSITLYGVKQ